jgi:hypothetical protein
MAKPLLAIDSSVKAGEWWKHLRPFGKRAVHKKVRAKVRIKLRAETHSK